MSLNKSRTAGLLFLILVVVIGVTITIAFLLIDPEFRSQRFIISLGAIVFAELLVCGYPIYFSLSSADRNSPRRVMGLGMYSVLLAYGAVTLLLAALAMTAVSFKWLSILHLASLGLLLTILLVWKIASGFVGTTATQEISSSNFIEDARLQIALQRDLPGISPDTKILLDKLDEVVRFTISESGVSVGHAERKIMLMLEQLDDFLSKQMEQNGKESGDAAKELPRFVDTIIHAFKERELQIRSNHK